MHTLLGISSLLFTLVGGFFLLAVLKHVNDWAQRRTFHLIILTMPLLTLGVGVDGLYHLIWHLCLVRVPFWDLLFGIIVSFALEVIAVGACVLALVRLVVITLLMKRRCLPATSELQHHVASLAQHLQVPSPPILLYASVHPLALTSGILHPTIVLSPWMLEHLDAQELDAVLTHELGHIARHDMLVIWLATLLRDAFFYLPTSRIAYRALQYEKELMCDDLSIRVTQRPLDLASALAKVWLNTLEESPLFSTTLAQPLVGAEAAINGRIERLLNEKERILKQHPPVLAFQIKALSGCILLIVQALNLIILVILMHCLP